MFVILLKFSANRDQAGQFMEGHMAWLKKGFDDGVFLMAGSLKPDLGGGIMAGIVSARNTWIAGDPEPRKNTAGGHFFARDIPAR